MPSNVLQPDTDLQDEAQYADWQVYIPPLEKDELLLDIRSACRVESAKAVVDDTYLGYIQQRELRQLLDEFALDAEGKEGGAAGCHGCALLAFWGSSRSI